MKCHLPLYTRGHFTLVWRLLFLRICKEWNKEVVTFVLGCCEIVGFIFFFFKIKNGWNSFIKSSMGVLVLILFICLCLCCLGKGGKAEGVISLPQWDVHTCDLRIPSLENPKRLRRHVCGRKRRRHEAAFSITPVNALEAECWAQNPRRSPGCCELEGALLWEQGVADHLTHLLSLQAPDKAPPPSPSSVA